MIKLQINGDAHQYDDALTIENLLLSMDLNPGKVAVERNLEIVPKSTFSTELVNDGDQIEIVHFIGGG